MKGIPIAIKKRPSSRGRRGAPRGKPKESVPVEELHPISDPPDIRSFRDWDLGREVRRAIREMNIKVPTPVQRLAIQPVLDGRDVIAKAETGTGKTLAFGAPMMSMIAPGRSSVLALVLCPTRELAHQVAEVLTALGEPRGLRVALIVGGDPIHPQIADLKAGAQVVVGTPGRVLDLHQQCFLTFPWTQFVVLDEADRMLEIGFLPDIKKILSLLPEERQTLLFSATYPREILVLARDETRDPVELATATHRAPVETITQQFCEVYDEDRGRVLEAILAGTERDDVVLVFCDRRTEVDRLYRHMGRSRFEIGALHGGYDQTARSQILANFRDGTYKALLATDLASRGLDVERVSHVVNFSVPRAAEDYTHRIGRTGRAGRTGTAITLVSPGDRRRWEEIRRGAAKDAERIEVEISGGSRERRGSRSSRSPGRRPRSRDRR